MIFFSNLDPQVQLFLQQLDALHLPPIDQIPIGFSRDNYEKMARYQGGVPVSMARTEDRVIPGGDGLGMKVRIYWPTLQHELPLLMYMHGGGWSRGSIDTHDALCRRLAKETNFIVISLNYRLAPENPFPAGYEDVLAGYKWCHENATSLGANHKKIAVGGDSAGGNLAAALVSSLADHNHVLPSFQLLIYPCLDFRFQTKSIQLFKEGFMLSQIGLNYYRDLYIPKTYNIEDYRISPTLYPGVQKICPTILLAADSDVLLDEGKEYISKLNQANVPTSFKVVQGVIHIFMQLIDILPNKTDEAYSWIAQEAKKYFNL